MAWFLCSRLHAQDWQNRDAFHFRGEVGKGYDLVVWGIPNFRTATPNNANIFFGVGRGDKNNWVEVMAQKQWSQKGGFWALDVRSRVQLTKRLSVYVEPTAFVTQPGVYHFAIVEYRVWKKLSLGGEEESVWRPASSTLPKQYNFGPRLSLGLGSWRGVDYGGAYAYRFSLTGLSESRVYFNVSARIDLRRGRK